MTVRTGLIALAIAGGALAIADAGWADNPVPIPAPPARDRSAAAQPDARREAAQRERRRAAARPSVQARAGAPARSGDAVRTPAGGAARGSLWPAGLLAGLAAVLVALVTMRRLIRRPRPPSRAAPPLPPAATPGRAPAAGLTLWELDARVRGLQPGSPARRRGEAVAFELRAVATVHGAIPPPLHRLAAGAALGWTAEREREPAAIPRVG